MSFAPYLSFSGGQCRPAMTFYASIFGATDLQVMTFGENPDMAPPGVNPEYLVHCQFSAGPGAPLLGSDSPDGWAVKGTNMTVFHAAPDAAQAGVVFAGLSDGAEVTMPLSPVSWSPAFGMLTDKFGTAWMITVAPGG